MSLLISCTLNPSAFSYVYKPIDVYVPAKLKEAYETDSNWALQVSNGKVIFHTIEDSTYDTEATLKTDLKDYMSNYMKEYIVGGKW